MRPFFLRDFIPACKPFLTFLMTLLFGAPFDSFFFSFGRPAQATLFFALAASPHAGPV